jgi:hypothetical protein
MYVDYSQNAAIVAQDKIKIRHLFEAYVKELSFEVILCVEYTRVSVERFSKENHKGSCFQKL